MKSKKDIKAAAYTHPREPNAQMETHSNRCLSVLLSRSLFLLVMFKNLLHVKGFIRGKGDKTVVCCSE